MVSLVKKMIDGVEFLVYPLSGQPKDEVEPWFAGFLELADNETILPFSAGSDDLIFQHEDGNFYLLPAPAADDDNKKKAFNKACFFLYDLRENPKVARISPAYRLRVLAAPTAESEADPLPGKSEISAPPTAKPYTFKPGTTAAAMAGGITLTNFLADRFRDSNAYMGGDKLLGSLSMDPVVAGGVVFPLIALMTTYSMVYATSVLSYMVENNGKFPDKDARAVISSASWKKGDQIGAGFVLIELVRPIMEDILGKTIQTAWSTASSSLGGVTAVVYPAVMLTVSLAVGLGMAAGSALAQSIQKHNGKGDAGKINLGEVFQAFTTGLLAGAVSTIDFGNKGFSFLATWAALTLVPAVKVAANVGSEREEMVESLTHGLNTVRGTVSGLWTESYNALGREEAIRAAEDLGAKRTGDSPSPIAR